MTARVRLALHLVALFVAYAATAKLGLAFDAVSGVATTVWPPTGLSLAALLFGGGKLWPAIALAAFAVNLDAGAPVAAAAGIAAGNTLEAVTGAWLLGKVDFSPGLARVRDVVALVILAALGSTAISATVGAGSLWLFGGVRESTFAEVWRVWWVGDIDGDLVVAPLLLCWGVDRRVAAPPRRLLEAGALAAALCGGSLLVFVGGTERSYLTFPAILWAALRFGPRGAATATFVLSGIAVATTGLGLGPFVGASAQHGLYELQTFVPIVATTALVLGAAIAERWQAVQLRDEFLSVASHELRTPLTSLMLRIEHLERGLRREGGDEKWVTKVAATGAQVRRLEKLVDELLDVSRISAGRLHLAPTEVDLGDLARGTASRLPDSPDISLQLTDGIIGHWDAGRIEQVLTNLLANALRHGAPPITLTVERDPGVARLIVADRGPGIPPADRRRLFDRFEQGVHSRRVGGLGLGLYIAREIVEAHGGTIHIDDAPRGGARVIVELPLEMAGRQ